MGDSGICSDLVFLFLFLLVCLYVSHSKNVLLFMNKSIVLCFIFVAMLFTLLVLITRKCELSGSQAEVSLLLS